MRLGDSGRERPPAAGAGARHRVRRPGRHGRQGDRPAAARRVPLADRGRRRARRRNAERTGTIFAAGDAVNGGASVVEAVREAKRAVRALDECAAMTRADRDPLACPRRAGRQDGRPDPRAGAAARRQGRTGVPGVRPGAARCADARVHARRRPARSAATTRSPTRTSSSCSSRRSSTRPASPTGLADGGTVVLCNAEAAPAELDRRRRRVRARDGSRRRADPAS